MTFVTERQPPESRVSRCGGPLERHLTEAAVMLAVAQWLFASGAETVQVHPDGVHAKHFEMRGWLENTGFENVAAKRTTRKAGRYRRNRQCLLVDFRPGRGDVVATVDGRRVVVEAKGGCINTRHPGQVSKLRKHLYEAVGMLLDGHDGAERLIAAVPRHAVIDRIAGRMARRCRGAGIEIALVWDDGAVVLCAPRASESHRLGWTGEWNARRYG